MNGEMTLREKVELSTNMQRKVVITFPVAVFREFDEYCKLNSGDCYWLGIEQLLTFKREALTKEAKIQMLMDRDEVNFKLLSEKINALDKRLLDLEDQPIEDRKTRIKTFGKGVGNE